MFAAARVAAKKGKKGKAAAKAAAAKAGAAPAAPAPVAAPAGAGKKGGKGAAKAAAAKAAAAKPAADAAGGVAKKPAGAPLKRPAAKSHLDDIVVPAKVLKIDMTNIFVKLRGRRHELNMTFKKFTNNASDAGLRAATRAGADWWQCRAFARMQYNKASDVWYETV